MQLSRLLVLITATAGLATASQNCTLSNAEPLQEPALQDLKSYNSAIRKLLWDTKDEIEESMGKSPRLFRRQSMHHMICMSSKHPLPHRSKLQYLGEKVYSNTIVVTGKETEACVKFENLFYCYTE